MGQDGMTTTEDEMQTGVYALNDGYVWRCSTCPDSSDTPTERERARDDYKAHRALCPGAVAAPKPPPQSSTSEKEKKVPAVKKKSAKKKATKKATKKKVAKKKVARKKGKKTWRFAIITSPKGREITPRVSKTGKLSSRAAKRLKMTHVPKWGRVQADTRQAALRLLRAGKGEWFSKAKGEPA